MYYVSNTIIFNIKIVLFVAEFYHTTNMNMLLLFKARMNILMILF
jgi:hypothetical protein